MTEERNDGLHPRHPGVGKPTSLIAADSEEAEVGGLVIFFPSGATKYVHWRQASPITPTFDAAKQFAAKVIESLQKDGLGTDIDRTNWSSVVAAIQKVVLDWNSVMQVRIGAEMAKRFGGDPTRLMH